MAANQIISGLYSALLILNAHVGHEEGIISPFEESECRSQLKESFCIVKEPRRLPQAACLAAIVHVPLPIVFRNSCHRLDVSPGK